MILRKNIKSPLLRNNISLHGKFVAKKRNIDIVVNMVYFSLYFHDSILFFKIFLRRLFMKKLFSFLILMLFSLSVLAAVNVNTATKEELQTLSGIGPEKAQAIIDYRTEHGPFKSVDDLTKVKGLGEKTVEKLRPDVTISSKGKAEAKSETKKN
jgi:competence protein ComEA